MRVQSSGVASLCEKQNRKADTLHKKLERKIILLREKQGEALNLIRTNAENGMGEVSKLSCWLEQMNASVVHLSAVSERMDGSLKQMMAPAPVPDAGRMRIVINTLPKVGSWSMVATLRTALPDATIEHTHAMSLEGQGLLAKEIEASADGVAKDAMVGQLRRMMLVRPELDRLRAATSCPDGIFFICGLREPIAWALSTLFQLLDMGAIPVRYSEPEHARQAVMDWFSGRPLWRWIPEPGEWMHREITGYLGINPWGMDFDQERGYQVVDTNRGRLLFLRLENFDRLPAALGDLLTAPANLFAVEQENVACNKELGSVYKELMGTLKFPRSFVEKVYADPYAMTFYSEEERQGFAKRWSL